MRVLYISDPHLPYTRMDLWERIAAFNKTYKADRVLCSGDFADQYALSRFPKSPQGDPGHLEILRCIPLVKRLKKLFPSLEIIRGNHDDRISKRASEAGIADCWLKDFLQIVGAPDGWKWVDGDFCTIDKVVYTHGWLSSREKHAEFFNKSVAIGHLHSKLGLDWIKRENRKIFAMCVGTIADKNALALRYGPVRYSRITEGFGYITDGKPFVEAL